MRDKSKIMIVDDHPIFRKGLAQLINEEDDMAVCAEAETVFDAQKMIAKTRPDMLIVDISLKDASGLELVKYMRERNVKIPVLVLSMHEESEYAERAMKAGAQGFIMKQEMTNNVISAIRRVLSGKNYLSENMLDSILERIGDVDKNAPEDPVRRLSNRELEVFGMIGRGIKNGEIASRLNVSVKTVGTYRENIKKKLNARNSGQLMKMAIEWNKKINME
ncbi:MAG TPA: response regulator transcription factor [Spirochaetota bacterium]|nr:response regulator transcription factor [Spirochaetota bacterium]HRZ27668.1 response regulator transcription factor [Spirochaetota bacterium]HSA15969.1 response regulator transcription factor [Spirochaetota bacterium]